MEISVLVEPDSEKGFRAMAGEPFQLEAAGLTRESAIQQLRELIDQRLAAGAEVVSLSIGGAHPLAPFAGLFKGDPLVPAWMAAMEEYRAQQDALEGI